jgi:hypothetical protein
MTVEAELKISRCQYAADTSTQMASAIAELQAIQRAEVDEVDGVAAILDGQSDLAHEAGFEGIARLCQDMRHFLDEARGQHSPRLAVVASKLLDVCRTVQLHADAVGRCGMPELV